jgi:hypothetical protein
MSTRGIRRRLEIQERVGRQACTAGCWLERGVVDLEGRMSVLKNFLEPRMRKGHECHRH